VEVLLNMVVKLLLFLGLDALIYLVAKEVPKQARVVKGSNLIGVFAQINEDVG
jgi:hypothetical protein